MSIIEGPDFVTVRTFIVAGLQRRYTMDNSALIPSQWAQFAPQIGHVPYQVGATAYGVLSNIAQDGHTDYLTGVEVSATDGLPPEYATLTIPGQAYAVFRFDGEAAQVADVWPAILINGIPQSGRKITQGAPQFERYGPGFDPDLNRGLIEIFVPVEP